MKRRQARNTSSSGRSGYAETRSGTMESTPPAPQDRRVRPAADRATERPHGFKARARAFWYGWGRPFLVIVLVLSAFRSSFADWNDVPTGSMKPTILEGDRIFVNKLAYDLRVPFTSVRVWDRAAPERGDIVILFSPKDGTRLVKRVVAVPGDSVAMRANRLIVNGEPGAYGPLDPSIVAAIDPAEQPRHRFATERIGDRAHAVMFTPTKPAPRTFGPVTVPADKFCVMGDNRDNSGDSRVFGFADRSLIVGHVTGVVLSLDPDHHYLPRWRRWFHGLK